MIVLNYWFEDETFCIEFDGEFQRAASWYMPLMTRLRMELGAQNPKNPDGWVQSHGGSHNKVWKLLLDSPSLRKPISPEEAGGALERTIRAFQSYPHNLQIRSFSL